MGTGTNQWGRTTRLVFRFWAVYWLLFIVPAAPLWLAVVPWVGRHVFGVDATVRYWVQGIPGAGDSAFHYVQVFCIAVLAAAVSIIWSLLDRARHNHERLHVWLRVVLRFYLAAAMVVYGGGKLIPDQFPRPPLDKLVEPVANLTPIDLLWTFMGASPAYTIFTGAAEMLGGLLLTLRRTTFLGSLICAAVMSNVFLLNLGYDVPVKVFSAHLLLIAVFLAAPDLPRLAGFLLWNRRAEPVQMRPLFSRRWLDRGALTFRTVVVTAVTGLSLYLSYYDQTHFGRWAPPPPLYGIWDVQSLEIDGATNLTFALPRHKAGYSRHNAG